MLRTSGLVYPAGVNPYQPPSIEAEAAPNAPMAVGPLTVGGVLGQAISLYFGSIGTVAAITLTIFAPVELAKNFFIHAAKLGDDVGATTRVEMVVESAFGSLVTAALLHALLHKLRTGRALGVKEALSRGFRRWGNVFGARFRAGFIIVVGLLLLVIPGVRWMVKYALTDEIAALDPDRGANDALNSSAELGKGHGWTIFAVGLLAGIPVLTLQFLGGVASGFADSWVVTTLVDCVNDVIYRFFVPVMLLVYLGAGGQAETSAAGSD